MRHLDADELWVLVALFPRLVDGKQVDPTRRSPTVPQNEGPAGRSLQVGPTSP